MSEAIKEDQNNSEGRPCVLLVVDRTARHRSAAAAARTVATALQADLVEVEVGRGGDPTALHNPVATILNAAEQLHPAVIVLPSPASFQQEQPLGGSVAYDVIHRASLPVLLVPLDTGAVEAADGLLTKIVLAVDASTPAKRAARAVARIARPGAEVIVVHVHEVDQVEPYAVDYRIESVVAELQAAGLRVGVIQSHALPHAVADDIADVARGVRAGMIVVGSGGGSLLAGLVHGELFGAVLRRAQCPILVASRRER
jgi:nucleotide-binding universal stress UspA family protein